MDDQNTKTRRLNKVSLNAESYDSLLKMLESNEEDRILAFECLNNLNQKDSLIYTIFLRKYNKYKSEWIKHCPKVVSYHQSHGIEKNTNIITFPTIWNIVKEITEKNKDKEVLNFFTCQFAMFIKDSLNFDFIESVDVKFKIRENDK